MNTKRFKCFLLATSILIVGNTFVGCSSSNRLDSEDKTSTLTLSDVNSEAPDENVDDEYFIKVGESNNGEFAFYYDRYTKVMYYKYFGVYEGNFSVLYNTDGNVMTYDKWCNLEESEE